MTRIEPVGKPYREVCLQTKLWPWKVHQSNSYSKRPGTEIKQVLAYCVLSYYSKYIVPFADSSTDPHFLFYLTVTLTFKVRTWKFTGLKREGLPLYQPNFAEIRWKIIEKKIGWNLTEILLTVHFNPVSPCDLDLRPSHPQMLFYKLLSIKWPNMRKIRWKMAEKPQNADSGKEIK